jgi:DNA-binding NtrC family response regulator
MPSLWIVHRDPALRAALVRLAAAPDDTAIGGPGDAVFGAAAPPDAVVLGLAGDLEAELEFAHREGRRAGDAAWILVSDPARLERARQLFDALPAEFLVYPPEARLLRRVLATGSPARAPVPLSLRPARDTLSERFARAFGDLELPALLRAIDPRLGDVPLLVLGEPGTGRGTLARYVHEFGATAGGAFVELVCTETTNAAELAARISAAGGGAQAWRACTLGLDTPERLPEAAQREVAAWIEFGLPAGTLRTRRLRWIGISSGQDLCPYLRRALGGISLAIPPLRERPALVANLARATAHAWCAARGVRPRRLGEHALTVLEDYPWPGNLRELEAVIGQSLAASAADPLGPEDLVLDGEPFAPLAPGAPRIATTTLVEPDEDEERAEALPLDDLMEELEGVLEADLEPEPVPAVVAEPEALEDLEPLPEPEPAKPSAPVADARPTDPGALQTLAAALGHELRNPLTAVRTLAELLPESHADPEFRSRFGRLAAEGLERVERVLDRLQHLAGLPPSRPREVDVAGLLQEALDARRSRIRERHLVVLEELDRAPPFARVDPERLRFALEGVIDRTLELVPERGDVYVASRGSAGDGVRVLLRFRGPRGEGVATGALAPAANALEIAIAELLVRAQGGALTLDTSDPNETILVIDLPA